MDEVLLGLFLLILFSLLFFLIGSFLSVFGLLVGVSDFLLEPIVGLYYKIFKKEDKEDLSKDYSIEQGEEVK